MGEGKKLILITKNKIMKVKCLKHIESKTSNKRIYIYLIEDTSGTKSFEVRTKTLISFKERHILQTHNIYSVETFAVLCDLMKYFLNDSEVENKILLKELSEVRKFGAITNLTNLKKL